MVVISITLPADLLKKFDNLIRLRGYYSRSEAFRDAIRSLITETDLLDVASEKVAATIMVTSEYARKDIEVRVAGIRHEFDDIVIEDFHRHLDDKYCLEILIAEGTVQRIRDLIGRIRGMRGIQQVKTVFMPM